MAGLYAAYTVLEAATEQVLLIPNGSTEVGRLKLLPVDDCLTSLLGLGPTGLVVGRIKQRILVALLGLIEVLVELTSRFSPRWGWFTGSVLVLSSSS